jgi:hypothetical protein
VRQPLHEANGRALGSMAPPKVLRHHLLSHQQGKAMKRWSIVAAVAMTLIVAVWTHGYSAGLDRIDEATVAGIEAAEYATALLGRSLCVQEQALAALYLADETLKHWTRSKPTLRSVQDPDN